MSFSLLPDDRQTTPDDDIDAAIAGAVAIPDSPAPSVAESPTPFGYSWVFDWSAGQFVRAGGDPAPTTGLGAVIEWVQMAIHSERFANAVFSDEFGMEGPEEPIGHFAVGETLADWQRHLVDALLVHDRITSVENIDLTWDAVNGVLLVNSLDVVTDEDQTVRLDSMAVAIGGGE